MAKRRSSAQKRNSASPRVPEHLTNDLFHDLHHAAAVSYERTRAFIMLQPAPCDKQDTLMRELDAWAYDVYARIRNSLRERAQYALSLERAGDPLAIWRSAQEQIGDALSRAFAYNETQVRFPIPRAAQVCEIETRFSCSACAFVRWVHAFSREWLRLACDDPRSGIGVFVGWRAPAWATEDGQAEVESGVKISSRASAITTELLLNRAAAAVRGALENAQYDAFDWFIQQPQLSREPAFNSPLRKTIAKILMANPDATDLEVVERLDNAGERTPSGWKCETESFGWAWTHGQKAKIEHQISAVRTRLRATDNIQ
jgi:hypothetical protein